MGYDLHIIRGEEWSDPERPQVSMAEWRSIVEADSELQMQDAATATSLAGETVEYRNEGLAQWTAHPDRSAVWLDYRDGSIVAKNPDQPTIAKLLQIATALDARVQGDDGEFFDGSTGPVSAATSTEVPGGPASKGWRRFFRRR